MRQNHILSYLILLSLKIFKKIIIIIIYFNASRRARHQGEEHAEGASKELTADEFKLLK